MTADDQPPIGFDVQASPRLVADLPHLEAGQREQVQPYFDETPQRIRTWRNAEVWQHAFATATWVEAMPGGRLLDTIDPAKIDEVIVAVLERGNSGGVLAILRAGQRWIGLERGISETWCCGPFDGFDSGRVSVADRLADLVRFGFGDWERHLIGLPSEMDEAVEWARRIEEGQLISWTKVLDLLGGNRDRWSAALNALLWDGDDLWMRWDGGPAFHPTEITHVVASVQQVDDEGRGFDAALLRLHDGDFASLASENRFPEHRDLPGYLDCRRFAIDPVIHEDPEVVIAHGFTPEQRSAPGLAGGG